MARQRKGPLWPETPPQAGVSHFWVMDREVRGLAWHAYVVSPIDLGWERLPLAESVAADIAHEEAGEIVSGDEAYQGHTGRFFDALREAKAAARKIGWEGDYKSYSAPRVFWLPNPDDFDFQYGFVWKQDNNGATFIVSPFRSRG